VIRKPSDPVILAVGNRIWMKLSKVLDNGSVRIIRILASVIQDMDIRFSKDK
jgi:hypothetical protein